LRKRSPAPLLEPSLLRLDVRGFASTTSAVACARAVVVRGSAVSEAGVGLGFGVTGYEAEVVGAKERKPVAIGIRWETGEDILHGGLNGSVEGNGIPVKPMLDICCEWTVDGGR